MNVSVDYSKVQYYHLISEMTALERHQILEDCLIKTRFIALELINRIDAANFDDDHK